MIDSESKLVLRTLSIWSLYTSQRQQLNLSYSYLQTVQDNNILNISHSSKVMKIPAETLKHDEVKFSRQGSQNTYDWSHVCGKHLHKKIWKAKSNRNQVRKHRKNSPKHYKFSTCKNSNFRIIQSSLKTQVLEETDQSNFERDSNSLQSASGVCYPPPSDELPSLTRIPLEVQPYLQDIYQQMIQRECLYIPQNLKASDQCSQTNRNVLANWIFKICSKLKFKIQTFFLAVNILDRIMGLVAVKLSEMPVLAITTVFMASKYEQVLTYKLESFTALVPKQQMVTKVQILNLESRILQLLNFNMSYSNPAIYLQHIAETLQLCKDVKDIALNYARQLICSAHWRYNSSSSIAVESLKAAIRNKGQKNGSSESKTFQKVRWFERYLSRLGSDCCKRAHPFI